MAKWNLYSPEKIQQTHFDAIIVGSGMGGLSVAALLAIAGKRVLVLERHYEIGGFTHVFSRKGYEWDVGVHYIGDVSRKTSILRQFFDVISREQLEWNPMPAIYDRAIFPDRSYDFVAGKENFRAKMHSYFSSEKGAIDRYLALLEKANQRSGLYFAEKVIPGPLATVLGPALRMPYLQLASKTTLEVLQGLTRDPKLIGVLTTQYGDYGLPPSMSSFAIHALVARHYLRGGSYPVGGSGSIAETIVPTIESAGGQVLARAEVEKILVRDGKAIGVRLAKGEEFTAPIVISDAGAFNTWRKLMPSDVAQKHGMEQKLSQVQRSAAHLCLYAGLKVPFRELGIEPSNLWIFPDYDHDAAIERFVADPSGQPFPLLYVSFPSAKDPKWESRHPDRCTIEIVTLAQMEWFRKWQGTAWRKRGVDYEELKAGFAERMLETFYQQVPNARGKIDYFELSTPLSTQHFANYDEGEIYGLDHTPTRFKQSWLKPRTPVPGLFLTGQDVVTDGVAGALMGGVVCASAVLGRNLIGDLVKGKLKARSRQRAEGVVQST